MQNGICAMNLSRACQVFWRRNLWEAVNVAECSPSDQIGTNRRLRAATAASVNQRFVALVVVRE